MTLTRRSFLTGSLAAAAAGVVGARPAGAAVLRRVQVVREDHRVVVIGSGFGGGVTALRLAQAGVDVLVLERGKRWPSGPNANTFPTVQHLDQRALWYGSVPELFGKRIDAGPYAGLLEARAHPNMTVLCAAGVGGGSLAYQGMTLQPSEAVFNEWFPEQLDWKMMDRVHYPRVAKMLQVAQCPDDVVNTPNYYAPRVFKRNAERAGFKVEKIPMPIDWDYARREMRGEMKASISNGDCALGVNNGGKHSVDVTYIKQAEQTGRVTVAPLHNVQSVSRTASGKWRIEVEQTDLYGKTLLRKVITTNALFMSAGSVNTTQLLLRAKAHGDITGLPDALGEGWGTNADRIYTWTSNDENFGSIQGGPVVYGSKEWANPRTANTIIQASIPPVVNGLDPHTTMLVGFGVSAARGKWTYSTATDNTLLHWKHEQDLPWQHRIYQRIKAVAGPRGTLIDTNVAAPTTWHPLGGACMNTVCDLEGRVHDQRGLYVTDGALMPGTTAACNPSMTIAAVAERALDFIVRDDVGKVF